MGRGIKFLLLFLLGGLCLIMGAIALRIYQINPQGMIKSPDNTINIYDSARTQIPVSVTVPDIYISLSLPSGIDTLKVLNDYFATRVYNDTLRDDRIEAVIIDSISNNKRLSRNFSYKLLAPLQQNIYKRPEPVSRLFGGGYATINTGRFSMGPALSLQGKKEYLITAGIDPFNRSGIIVYQQPISLFKKK